MPNVLKALRAEIRQLARSETKRAAKQLRGQIQTLRRTLTSLERRLDRVGRAGTGIPVAAGPVAGRRARFSREALRQHRAKVGLSRKAYAKLLGVSSLSIYFWETGRTVPRRAAVLAWQDLRQEGVRALRQRAGVPPAAPAKPRPRRAKPAVAKKRATKPGRARRATTRRVVAKAAPRRKKVAKMKRPRARRGRVRRAPRAKAA